MLTFLPVQLAVAGIVALAVQSAQADVWQLPGPAGPLEGEAIAVAGAAHAVVIVPGSGPIDRNGNGEQIGLRSDSYRMLAEGLASRGIASLRIDKRGFFGSASAVADPNAVTIAGYADDTRAWVERAAELAPCVWIAGHSEGGLVALVAASQPPASLCGLILMATSGRPTGQLLIEQLQANPVTAASLPEIEDIVSDLENGQTRDVQAVSPGLHWLFAPGLQRFMVDLFAYDPAALATRWRGPALILQGDRDLQVKPRDAALLAEAMPQAARYELIGATHMLKSDQPAAPLATYADPDLPLHPQVVPSIAAFLDGHARVK